ncbi:MAG: hypothetical protein ABIM64_05575 [candidate division WOR-3 bacterium]
MRTKFLLLIIVLPLLIFSQKVIDKNNFHRDYFFAYYNNYDITNSSENFRTGLKIFSDLYYRGISSKIDNSFIKGVLGFTFSFTSRWFSMLWPHEFGHYLRAKQVGGDFSFVKFQFPGVVGDMDLPLDATLEDHTLALIGGFEANYLTTRDVQFDFYRFDGLYNDEYGMSFGNRIMYPFYAFLIAQQNPQDPQTWIISGGDPVNFTKLVWEMNGRKVFNPDSSINEGLVKFYNNAAYLSILWNLLDINLYKQVLSYFGDELKGKKPFYIGAKNLFWSYGTFFNTSPLGVELYFSNYLKVYDYFINLYIRYGLPFKNNGIGIALPQVLKFKNLSFGLNSDFWTQDYYGKGFLVSTNLSYRMKEKWNLETQISYKTKGYIPGKTTKEGLLFLFGIRYVFLE